MVHRIKNEVPEGMLIDLNFDSPSKSKEGMLIDLNFEEPKKGDPIEIFLEKYQKDGSDKALVKEFTKETADLEKKIAKEGFSAFLKYRAEFSRREQVLTFLDDKEPYGIKYAFTTLDREEEVRFYKVFDSYVNGKTSLKAVVSSAKTALELKGARYEGIRAKLEKAVHLELASLAKKNIFFVLVEYIKGTFSTLKQANLLNEEAKLGMIGLYSIQPAKTALKKKAEAPMAFVTKKTRSYRETAYSFSKMFPMDKIPYEVKTRYPFSK